MHTLGKVFLGFNVLGAIGAILLTAKLFDARNSYLERVEKLQSEVAQRREQLREKEREYQQAADRYAHSKIGWGDAWTNGVNVSLNNQGAMQVNQGTANNLGAPNPQQPVTLYVFAPVPGQPANLQSRYVGPFTTTQIGPNATNLQAAWDIRPTDFQGLQPGANWRIRSQIPDEHNDAIVKLRNDLLLKERILKDDLRYLAEQQAQDTKAAEIRDARLKQLNGDGMLSGLVAELSNAEDARNAELVKLDALRRQIKRTVDRIEQLLEENRELAKRLETQTSPVATKN